MSIVVADNIVHKNGSGTIYVGSGSSLVGVDAGSLYAPGQIIQTQHAQCAAVRYSIASADISAIPDLSVTFTPKLSTSKILLTAVFNTNALHVSTWGFLKNGSVIYTNTNTNSAGSIATTYHNTATTSTDYMHNISIHFWDTAGTTSAITYQAAGCASWAGTTYTLFINDRNSNDMRSISSMTVQEIAV